MKRSRRIFFIAFFLVAYLLSETGMFFIHCGNVKTITEDYQSVCAETANSLCDLFGSSLYTAVQSSNTLFNQTWYQHLRNNIGFYQDEFDEKEKLEIVTNFQRMKIAMPYITDIVMVIPGIDTVINCKGWLSLARYEKIYGDIAVSLGEEADNSLEITSSTPFILLKDPVVRKDLCHVALLIDTDKFTSALTSLLPETVTGVLIQTDKKIITEIGDINAAGISISRNYRYPAISFSFLYREVDTSAAKITFWLLSAVLLLLFMLIGAFLLHNILRPIHRLVMDNGGKKSDLEDPYAYVRTYIEQLQYSQNWLLNESRERENELIRLQERARQDALFGFLSGKRFSSEEMNILFPWITDGLDMCLLGLFSPTHSVSPAVDVDMLQAAKHIIQTPIGNDVFALLWLSEDMSRQEKEEYVLLLRHEWGTRNRVKCFCSQLFHTVDELEDIYDELKRDIDEGNEIHTALPHVVRSSIQKFIRSGSLEDVTALIQQLKAGYEPDDVYKVLIITEANTLEDKEGVTWEQVTQAAEHIMQQKLLQTLNESVGNAEKYARYVKEHYSDSDLSVSSVAEYFGKHRTIISKEIKRLTGYSFSDYLRRLRIAEAMERIDQGEANIMQIASDVGFISYSTFKRSFVQITGKTPMEYRDGNSCENNLE